MGAATDGPPPDKPGHLPLVMWWDGSNVVGEAYHLAMLGAQRLIAGEFLEANHLLRSASRLANRAAFLTEGYGRRPRDKAE